MHLSTLRSVGGSVMFAIPKQLLDTLGLSAGAPVGLTLSKGKLVVEPRPKPRYTLEELVAQCDPNAPISPEVREWLDLEPVGREIIPE